LRFSSYFFTRQIFDLNEYYRLATDDEVESFSESGLLSIANKDEFRLATDSWIRRKIAAINDSGVLKNNTAAQIKKLAQKCGIEITIQSNRMVIPTDKKKLKEVLSFLDDAVYKSVFTGETYVANSKRKMR
jgi:hypothetical protein